MKDKFTKKAFAEGYKARSVYKLKSINSRFRIIRKGSRVLDLGAWPGSWSQYCLELGAGVDAVDLKDINIKGINYIKADVFSKEIFNSLKKYDVVISDLAPKTTGLKKLDNESSFDLSLRALEIASNVLFKDGSFVCKIFNSEFFDGFIKKIKTKFKLVRVIKPIASKKRSKEIYVIGIRKI